MLDITERAFIFGLMSWLSYAAYKASDALRGWIADGRAEDCFAITAVFALAWAFTVRHYRVITAAAAGWAAALLLGTVAAAVSRWPPPLMMILVFVLTSAAATVEALLLRRRVSRAAR